MIPREQVGTALVEHFLDRWEGDETLMALLRAGATNEAAAERMRQLFADQLGPVVAKLGGDPADTATRSGLAATQVLGFALCRYVLALPPIAALPRDQVIAWLAPTLHRYLTAPTP